MSALPRREPSWALNMSTQIASLAAPTGYDTAAAAAWGLVTFDWSNSNSASPLSESFC